MTRGTDIQTVYLPGPREEEWVTWIREGTGWRCSGEREPAVGPSLAGLPARSLLAHAFHPATDEPAVAKGAAKVQWELRGLPVTALPPQTIGLRLRTSAEPASSSSQRHQALVVACLDNPIPATFASRSFEASPLLHRPTGDGIFLWKEHGHWISLFASRDEPVYFQVLTEPRFGEHLLAELDAARQSLLLEDLIPPPRMIEIDGSSWGPSEDPPPASALGLPLILRPPEGPVLPPVLSGVMPTGEAERARRERTARHLLWAGGVAAAFWLIWLASGLLTVRAGEAELRRLRASGIRDAPVVERIRKSRDLAERMRPATDATLYPLEQFHLAVSLLPDEGVRLTHFELDGDRLLLRGEASSSASAVSWRGKLRGSEAFRDFTWDFPQPEILPDNRARFVAQGTRITPAYPAPPDLE